MKKLLFALITTVIVNYAHSQKIDIILLTGYGATTTFYYGTSDKTMISISSDGKSKILALNTQRNLWVITRAGCRSTWAVWSITWLQKMKHLEVRCVTLALR